MGEVDIVVLNEIYRKCIELEKEHNWGFQFKEDSGSFETMIQFIENVNTDGNVTLAAHHPPKAANWDEMKICNAPDILDFNNKIIIEFEEESLPQKGPKIRRKGHWAESKRDTNRDQNYNKAGFRVCKIWQNELKKGDWPLKLFYFLADCFTNRDTTPYGFALYTREDILEQRRIFAK